MQYVKYIIFYLNSNNISVRELLALLDSLQDSHWHHVGPISSRYEQIAKHMPENLSKQMYYLSKKNPSHMINALGKLNVRFLFGLKDVTIDNSMQTYLRLKQY